MDRYKFALQLVWNILSKPDETLRYEALLNKFYGKNVFKHFVMPLAEVLFVVVFIASLFSFEMNFVTIFVKSFFNVLSFVVAYGT